MLCNVSEGWDSTLELRTMFPRSLCVVLERYAGHRPDDWLVHHLPVRRKPNRELSGDRPRQEEGQAHEPEAQEDADEEEVSDM